MRISIITEQRFFSTPGGSIWDQTTCSYEFWKRYLNVFDSVNIIARVMAGKPTKNCRRVDGPNVTVTKVPCYIGPLQYIKTIFQVRRVIRGAILPEDAVLLRVPSNLATVAERLLLNEDRPYGVEVVGDPHEVFAPGTIRHPLRIFFKLLFVRQVKTLCRDADCAAYVTQQFLQERYPPGNSTFSTNYSSIELGEEAYREPCLPHGTKEKRAIISFIGSFAQLYKGPDVLIDAVARCVSDGWDINVLMIGGGRYQNQMERKSQENGLDGRIRFFGKMPSGHPIREQLDKSNLFILPSRTEGLPRAMIEAMARGLPCIGSNAGGIPELLPAEDLVAPDDTTGLAKKILQVLNNPQRMQQMGQRNYQKAREYHKNILDTRRQTLYAHLYASTETWIEEKSCR